MKQNIKGIIFIGVSLVTLISAYNLYINNYIGYAILCATFAFIFMLFGIGFLIYENDPEKLYQNNVRNILNTYDSILEKGNEIPKLTGKNIIVVTSMDDMVDVQNTIKKPIFYYKQTESCSFVLLSDSDAYIYINKFKPNVISSIEIEINSIKQKHKKSDDIDSEVLKDIEKTTIVKLPNKKSYKVSPVRKENTKKSNDQEEII